MKSLLIRTSLLAMALSTSAMAAEVDKKTAGTEAETPTASAKPEAAAKAEGQQQKPAQEEKKQTLKEALQGKEAQVIVTIGGAKFTVADFMKFLKTFPEGVYGLPAEEAYPVLLDRFKEMKTLTQAAERAKIKDSKPYQIELDIELAKFINAFTQKFFLDAEIKKEIAQNPQLLQKKYEEVKKAFEKTPQYEYALKMIVVKNKAEADKVLNDLKKGGDFKALAEKHSIDPQTKGEGGKIPGFTRAEDLPADLAAKVIAAKSGTIIQEIIALGDPKTGPLAIFGVDDKQKIEFPTFEQLKPELKKAIAPEVAVTVMKKLEKEFNTELFELDGKTPLKMPERKEGAATPAAEK